MALQTQEAPLPADVSGMIAQGPILLPDVNDMTFYEPLNPVAGTTGEQMRVVASLTATGDHYRLFPQPGPEEDPNRVTERILYRRLPTA